LLLPSLSPHSILKFLLSKHFKSKWFCCLNSLVSLTLFFFLVFLKNFQTKWSFPSLPSLFSMVGHNKPYTCNNLSNSHHVVSYSKFYSYWVLFLSFRYIFNIDFQYAISKFINLYLSTFLSS
jgi:hypothetical protein